MALVSTTGISLKTRAASMALTSSGAERSDWRSPPLTQTTSSEIGCSDELCVPARRHDSSSSRQRSTPRRARRARWAPSLPAPWPPPCSPGRPAPPPGRAPVTTAIRACPSPGSRGVGDTFQTFGIDLAGNIFGNLFREFVLRRLESVPTFANGKH